MATALKTWDEYLDALKPAGDLIKRSWKPGDELTRAELYRQLVMNIGYAYFQYFQSNETHPDFMPIWNSAFVLQPNPDDAYLWAPIQGDLAYRVVGNRGSIHMVNFTIGHHFIGMSDTPKGAIGFVDLDACDVASDGSFDIVFSTEKPEGCTSHWEYLDPRAEYLLVRQRSYDWGQEADCRIAIECLDAQGVKRQMPVEEIAERMEKLLQVPERWSALWIDFQNDMEKTLPDNQFEINEVFSGYGAVRNQAYLQAIFNLQPDEALILETELPGKRQYWNFQMNDTIFNAIEFVYRQSSLNGHQARIDSDGRFRAVISKEDPGVHNWLDTGGYDRGTIIGRWLECSSYPLPTLKKVPFADIRKHLPADVPAVTPEERKRLLRERHLGAQLRRRW